MRLCQVCKLYGVPIAGNACRKFYDVITWNENYIAFDTSLSQWHIYTPVWESNHSPNVTINFLQFFQLKWTSSLLLLQASSISRQKVYNLNQYQRSFSVLYLNYYYLLITNSRATANWEKYLNQTTHPDTGRLKEVGVFHLTLLQHQIEHFWKLLINFNEVYNTELYLLYLKQ